MAAGDGEISIRLVTDQTNRWRIVPLSVGQDLVLEMIPNPGFPHSVISRTARDALLKRGLVSASRTRLYLLKDLRIEGVPISELEVRVSLAPQVLGLDGMLGMNFFEPYAEIRWDVRAHQLILVSK